MMPGLVVFNHGKESGPWGAKIQRLAQVARAAGWLAESVDYTGLHDPDARAQKLLATPLPAHTALVLVGSSMGGYVATLASATLKPDGLFLLAPAFFRPEYAEQSPTPHARHLALVHGWRDTVLPFEDSLRYAQHHRAQLHLVDDDHRLQGHLPLLAALFAHFLESVYNARERR
jgi:alpha/beta superfamily hydrolase